MIKKKLMLATLVLATVVGGVFVWQMSEQSKVQAINSFEACVAAGYPVMESYPEQCQTPDGRSFSRELTNQMPPADFEGSWTVTGEVICLPHQDTSGPQTLECAYGIEADDGTFYALRDSDPSYKNLSGLPTGQRVEITGNFTPQEDTKYQSIGVLEIVTVTKL